MPCLFECLQGCQRPALRHVAACVSGRGNLHWLLCAHGPLSPSSPLRSGTDCVRAVAAGLSSAPCLCDGTGPYLHCHALATKEAAAKLQSTLAEADVVIDPGAWVYSWSDAIRCNFRLCQDTVRACS